MNRRLAVLVLLALVPSALHAAEPVALCGVEAPPLLYAISSFLVPISTPVVETRTLFILQGGPTLLVNTPRPPEDIRPSSVEVSCGQADPAAYRKLVEAMAAVRIGFQGNCHAPPIEANFPEAETLFTWFGRGRRQNTFVVTSRNVGLPPCPPAIDNLINELDEYLIALQHHQTVKVPAPCRPARSSPSGWASTAP